jgi:D-serine deaminase-like pyridoxal phosphate-dependent protein
MGEALPVRGGFPDRASGLGLRLRPHAKTYKSAFVARRQLERRELA